MSATPPGTHYLSEPFGPSIDIGVLRLSLFACGGSLSYSPILPVAEQLGTSRAASNPHSLGCSTLDYNGGGYYNPY